MLVSVKDTCETVRIVNFGFVPASQTWKRSQLWQQTFNSAIHNSVHGVNGSWNSLVWEKRERREVWERLSRKNLSSCFTKHPLTGAQKLHCCGCSEEDYDNLSPSPSLSSSFLLSSQEEPWKKREIVIYIGLTDLTLSALFLCVEGLYSPTPEYFCDERLVLFSQLCKVQQYSTISQWLRSQCLETMAHQACRASECGPSFSQT